MKKTCVLVAMLLLACDVSAAGYLERLHDLDQQLICAISWFTVPVATLMVILGGLLMMLGDPDKKGLGKALVKNAFIGMLLVVTFILLSIALMPTITLSACI